MSELVYVPWRYFITTAIEETLIGFSEDMAL